MAEFIATAQMLAAGNDWTGVAPDVAARDSLGVRLFEGSAQGGLIVFSEKWWTKIDSIMLRLDGVAHAAAAVTGTLTLVVNGMNHVIEPNLSNEEDYVWRGGPLVVPPRSRLLLNFAVGAAPTIVQQMFVVHEKFREINNGSIV